LAGVGQAGLAGWSENVAMAVVVTLTVLTLGPQIAVTRLAKVVFNGCVKTT
jgi:hypothetical protein